MEITLKGNSDQIHRIAFDEDDYTLIIQSQGATDEFAEVWKDENYNSFAKTNSAMSEFIVLLESDRPVNFEAYTLWQVLSKETTQDVWDEFPDGQNKSFGCMYYGDPHVSDNVEITNVDSDTVTCYISAVAQPYDTLTDPSGFTGDDYSYANQVLAVEVLPTKNCFRVADCSTFACFKMVGEDFRILLGEHDSIPANYELKVYRKTLVEEA